MAVTRCAGAAPKPTRVADLNPTGDRDGSEEPYIQTLAAAVFDPDLAATR